MSFSYHYKVRMVRVEPKAGPNADLSVEVTAPNDQMAKRCAEGQFHGYRAIGAIRIR